MHTATSATLADFPGDVLTVEQAGRVLDLSRSSAYDAARRGDIPTIRIGKRLIVPKRALETMLSGNGSA
jgi:excisionase family DNA binding protein